MDTLKQRESSTYQNRKPRNLKFHGCAGDKPSRMQGLKNGNYKCTRCGEVEK